MLNLWTMYEIESGDFSMLIDNENYEYFKKNPKEITYEFFNQLEEENKIEIFSLLDRILSAKELATQWNVKKSKVYYYRRKYKEFLDTPQDPLNIHTINLDKERKMIKNEMNEKDKEIQIYRELVNSLQIESAKETLRIKINGHYSTKDILEKVKSTLLFLNFTEGKVEVIFEVIKK